jgi:hypothetical protein
VALKRKFDPTNFFRCNQNINPAADANPNPGMQPTGFARG